MITKENRTETIKKHGAGTGDTGSASVQIALLTERIKQLSTHLKAHKNDFSSQRGLLQLVGQRRRLLTYLKGRDLSAYNALIKQLDLRK